LSKLIRNLIKNPITIKEQNGLKLVLYIKINETGRFLVTMILSPRLNYLFIYFKRILSQSYKKCVFEKDLISIKKTKLDLKKTYKICQNRLILKRQD